MGAELFHADGRTNRRKIMTKLVVASRKFANAPENHEYPLPNLQKVKL